MKVTDVERIVVDVPFTPGSKRSPAAVYRRFTIGQFWNCVKSQRIPGMLAGARPLFATLTAE